MSPTLCLTRSPRLHVVASSSPKKPSAWNRFVNKRQSTIKENLSRFAMIGMADIKDVYQALKDLDDSHKKAIENVKKSFKEKLDDVDKASDVTEAAEEPSTIFESNSSE